MSKHGIETADKKGDLAADFDSAKKADPNATMTYEIQGPATARGSTSDAHIRIDLRSGVRSISQGIDVRWYDPNKRAVAALRKKHGTRDMPNPKFP